MIEKINMQAVLNASVQEDEFIKDFLISYGKVIVYMCNVYFKIVLFCEVSKFHGFTFFNHCFYIRILLCICTGFERIYN